MTSVALAVPNGKHQHLWQSTLSRAAQKAPDTGTSRSVPTNARYYGSVAYQALRLPVESQRIPSLLLIHLATRGRRAFWTIQPWHRERDAIVIFILEFFKCFSLPAMSACIEEDLYPRPLLPLHPT